MGDYLFVKNGFAFKSKDYIEDGIPVIRISDINNQKVSSVKSVKVSESNVPEGFELEYGDLLIAMSGATTGKTGVYLENSYVVQNQRVGNIRLTSLVNGNPKFRNYLIQGLSSKIFELAYGGAQPNISPRVLESINIPLPPLNEQKRIAKKLDELLATVESIKTRLDNAPTIIKRFRQSILSAATSGKLTEEWREENANISFSTINEKEILKLVDSYYKIRCNEAIARGKRKPKHPRANKKSKEVHSILAKIPETWKYIRLEDISYLVSDGTHQTPKYVEEGVPFFSVKNVRPFKISDENIKYVSEEEFAVIDARCSSNLGDILYTKVGATFGYAAMNTINYKHTIYVSLALIKPVKEYFCSKYAEITMNSNTVFNQAKERVSGSGVPDLHLIEIRDFKIPIPPLAEQKEIVSQVELLFALADTLEEKIEAAKKRVDKLTQSILAKAFRGELVEQDPDDESAEDLLERIRAEQVVEKPKKTRRKK